MGKSTISIAMFNSYVKLPEGMFDNHATKLFGNILDGVFFWGETCGENPKVQ